MSYRDRDRDEPYNRDKGYGRTSFEKKHADAAPKIFIGNIPYTTSDEEVKAHFETCGRVQEVLVRVVSCSRMRTSQQLGRETEMAQQLSAPCWQPKLAHHRLRSCRCSGKAFFIVCCCRAAADTA
jgi:hypothetical protein